MKPLKVYLEDKISINIDKSEFEYMKEHNIINSINDLHYINRDSKFFYLYNIKSDKKKRFYLKQLNKQKFICQHCGKEHSYNISPSISADNEVDFKTILCCCSDCRKKKLENRHIIKPIYKQKINWEEVEREIKLNYKKFRIMNKYKDRYRDLCIKILLFERYVDLVLPKRNLSNYKYLNKEVNLKIPKEKYEFKTDLYKRYKGMCPICGKEITFRQLTIDHIVARKLGGKDNVNNLIGMCEKCNQEKGHKTVLEYLCEKELYYMPNLLVYIAKQQQKAISEELVKLYKEKEILETKFMPYVVK